MIKYLLIILSILTCISCADKPYYTQSYDVNADGWSYDNTIRYEVAATDTLGLNDMHLNIVHDANYSYENLYLKIVTTFPSGEKKEEQLNIDLASNNGQWQGKCSSNFCTIKVYLLDKFKFADQGNYIFEIQQYSREENLQGIQSLEIQLYNSIEKK